MKRNPINLMLVTLVRLKNNSALVEYVEDGAIIRKYVPADKLENNFVPEEVLQQGIPYGYPWEEISITFDSRKFADELHKVGIWTTDDALKSPQKLWSALRAALADNITNILTVASQERKGKSHG